MAPSYIPLRAKQLLSETFLSIGFSFRDIRLDHLKWDTLYINIQGVPRDFFHRSQEGRWNRDERKRLYCLTIFVIIIDINF